MKDESKKINFRKLPKKLLSCLLALVMLVGMVQVAFTVAPVAHAAWTDTMGTLNEMLWRCSYYNTMRSYTVTSNGNRNRTISDASGNSSIWHVAVAFQDAYWALVNEAPGHYPEWYVNTMWNSGLIGQYDGAYDLLWNLAGGGFYSNTEDNKTSWSLNNKNLSDESACYVQIVRDTDCILRDWAIRNVNDLQNSYQSYFYYAWTTGINKEDKKTLGIKQYKHWYYMNGGINGWQNVQYADTSSVQYLKNYINYFFNVQPSIWTDFGTLVNGYDQDTLYNLAVNANNNYYPIGNVSWNVVYYWVLMHGSGLWGAIDVTNGNPYDAIDNYWRFQVTGQDLTPYYVNANNLVNQIPAYVTNVNNAYQSKAYVPYVDYINTVRQPGYYNTEDIAAMQEIYNNTTNFFYNVLNPASAEVKNILAAYSGYDEAATVAFINQLAWDINTFYVRSTKNNIDAYMYQYYGAHEYTDEQKQQYGVVYNTRYMDDNTLTWLRDSMQSFSDTIDYYWNNGYSSYIAQLFSDVGTDYYHNYIASLNWELTRRGAETNYGAYYGYFVPKMVAPYATYSTADLEATIGADVGTQINFNNDFNYFVSTIGAAAANEAYRPVYNGAYQNFNQETNGYINALFDVLNNRLIGEIEPLLTMMAPYNNQITVDNFSAFKSMRKNIEDGIYTWLSTNYPDRISAELAQKYAALQNLYAVYENFMNTWTPDKIEKVDLSEEYPVRPGTSSDYARVEGEDFAVTKENLNASISKLDNFLYSEDFAKLLKLEEEGTNVNNLSSYVDNLLGETVFNNEMMNTLVSALMPMLQETLESELKKAIAENNPYNINVQTEVLGQDATVTGAVQFFIDNDLCDGVQKQSDLPTLFKQLGLYVYPNTFAEMLPAFPEIQNALYAAGRNWGAFADADGDVELNFDWGIDNLEGTAARYERFKEVLSSVFNASLPVLKTLLGTAAYNNTVTNAVFAKTTEKLRAYVKLFGSNIELASSSLNANADLTLGIEGVDLFRKVWIPVMEALGLNTTEHPYNFGAISEASTSLDIVNAMFGPIYELINELVSSPISRVVEMIPNLAYMVSFDKLSDLFNMNVNLHYSAKLRNVDASNDIVDAVLKLGILDNLIQGDLSLNVADMIDINELLGFDTSDFNSILSFVLDAADLGDVAIPSLNIGKYMSYATVNTNYPTQRVGSQRVYFTADKADVFFAFIKELVSALGNQGFVDNIIGALNSNRTNPIELSDDIQNIINSLSVNPDSAVCAIIELLNPQSYAFEKMNWFDMAGYDAIDGVTPASVAYLNYGNNWTKEKAEYIAENIDEITTAVLNTAGVDSAELRETLTSAINNVFTNKTITSVMKTFVKFGGSLDETLSELVSDETGVDLSLWADAFGYLFDEDIAQGSVAGLSRLTCAYDSESDTYVWSLDGNELEDGDIDAFSDMLCYILEGISPLVSFIMTGEDISLFAGAVTAKGYKGYGEAIPYLFEALGIENVLTQAQYEAAYGSNPTAGLNYIVTTLISRVDGILENPVSEILDVIPSIVYYLESNGLSTAIKALLKPVLVLVDTIRPIYNAESIDPNSIIKDLIADLAEEYPDVDIEALRISIDDLSLEKIIEIADVVLEAKAGVEIKEIVSPAVRALCNTKVSYSSAASDNTGYTVTLDRADTITVLVTTFIELLQYGNNAQALDEMLETDGLLPAVLNVFSSTVTEMMEPNWAYVFEAGTGDFDYNNLPVKADLSAFHTVNRMSYDTNWNEETAKYVDENLESIILDVLRNENPDASSIADFISDLEIYSGETVASLAKILKEIISKLDPVIIDVLSEILEADLSVVMTYSENADDYNVTDGESFVSEITEILRPVEPLLAFMLLGKDISYLTSSGVIAGTNKGDDVINIQGAEGYAYGIIPLLEALGCEPKAPSEYFDENGKPMATELLSDSLSSICAVIDRIMADPLNEILSLLPNLIYFVNANGLTVAVNNTLASLLGIVDTINTVSDEKLDLDEMIGIKLNDLSFNGLFEILKQFTEKKDENGNVIRAGLDLNSTIGDTISTFYVGEIEYFTSANGRGAFRMNYNASEDRMDMITVLLSVLTSVVKDAENADFVEGIVGKDVFEVILNVLNIYETEMQKPSWLFTQYADTNKVFSAFNSSEIYEDFDYGTVYTRDMAQYIADHIDEFIDNVIYLLGIEIEGVSVDNLEDILNITLNGSIYNAETAQKLLDAIRSFTSQVDDIQGSKHIKALVKSSLGIDLDAWDSITIPQFESDRTKFTNAICDILSPLAPVLRWALCGEDFTFFVDEDGKNSVTLLGAEGYAFGIIPILEALSCKNIMTPAQYCSAAKADDKAIIKNILNPLLNKVDEIMADPTDKILEILPAVIYFINSNGLDTCFKNALHAVYTLLDAVKPLVEVDLYELIDIRLDELTFESIYDYLLEEIAENTGYELTALSGNAISELTLGKLVSYTSKNGEKAYTMVYQSKSAKADMITIILRLMISFIMTGENMEKVVGILKDNFNMSAESEKYVRAYLNTVADYTVSTKLGMHKALALTYYVFFGVDKTVGGVAGAHKDVNKAWQNLIRKLDSKKVEGLGTYLGKLLDAISGGNGDIVSEDGVAQNGAVNFFQRIINWFKSIFEKIKAIFK